MALEDVPCSHVVVAESVAGGLWLGTILRSARLYFRFFAVGSHLIERSFDGVEMCVESTVASHHVEDGSEAHPVLNAVAVKSVDNREVTGSYD